MNDAITNWGELAPFPVGTKFKCQHQFPLELHHGKRGRVIREANTKYVLDPP